MITVNDEPINFYFLDDQNSIIERIADKFETLPKYLYPTRDYQEGQEYTVNNLLAQIKQAAEKAQLFSKFYEQDGIQDLLEEMNLDLIEDIFVPYLAYYSQLHDPKLQMYVDTIQLTIQQDIKNNLPQYYNVLELKKKFAEKGETKENLLENINRNTKKVQSKLEYIEIVLAKKPIPATKFKTEESTFEMDMEMNHDSIMEVFNAVQLNEEIPFLTINGYFKILKTFQPPIDWEEQSENYSRDYPETMVFMMVRGGDNFITITLSEKADKLFTITGLITTSKKKPLTLEIFQEHIRKIFPYSGIIFKKPEFLSIKGTYFYPRFSYNIYILSELIMNSTFFSDFLAIDEHEKTTKSKSHLHIHFQSPQIDKLSFNITNKKVVKNEPELRHQNPDNFPIGSDYVRVLIGFTKNPEYVEYFREHFGRLLSLYREQEPTIYMFYRSIIGTNFKLKVPSQEVSDQDAKKTLRSIAPDVFIAGYALKCNNKPRIIDDTEAEIKKQEGFQIFKFPKTYDEGFDEPRNYICDTDKTHPFPGLRSNPLSNNDIVPGLPCCFTKDQLLKDNSITKSYVRGEEYVHDQGKQQGIVKTNKFAENKNFAILPQNISNVFHTVNPKTEFEFFRKGMQVTQNSFIDCVVDAFNGVEDKNLLQRLRSKFALQKKCAVSCSQEMFDYTIEEIQAMIGNQKKYFDPMLFVNLIEEIFLCNVFIFNRKSLFSQRAELTLPRHSQLYYRRPGNNPVILIYQHKGSTANINSEIPVRCELIVRKNKVRDMENKLFDWDDPLIKFINTIFKELNENIFPRSIITDNNFPIDTEKIESQSVDSYGKTRSINYKYDRHIITIITTPLQPFLKELQDSQVYLITYPVAIAFIESNEGVITAQEVYNENCIAYIGMLGNVEIKIPIFPSPPNPTYRRIEVTINPYQDVVVGLSMMEKYNKSKLTSKYLVEYSLWLYSKYLHESNPKKSISIESMSEFADNCLEIDRLNQITYTLVNKKFSIEDGGVMYKGKLIVKSEEEAKRLMYNLRIFSRNRRELYDYRKRKNMYGYYDDLANFDVYESQVIMYGSNSITKWINEFTLSHKLFDSVVQDRIGKPYFFQNKLVGGGKLYLAINMENTPLPALNITKIWREEGYLNFNFLPETQVGSIKTYIYKDPTTIQEIQDGSDAEVLAYLEKGEVKYTVLLEFNR